MSICFCAGLQQKCLNQEWLYQIISEYWFENQILQQKEERCIFYEGMKDGIVGIAFIEEEKPLGTAGSLGMLSGKINIPFFVTNCDILVNADYGEIYRYHMKTGNMATIVSALKSIEVPYGVVQSNGNGNVSALEEKPHLSYFVNTGMYILSPGCFKYIPEDTFFHMTDLLGRLLDEEQGIGMYPVSEESFLDMGEWEELQRMEQKLKQNTD